MATRPTDLQGIASAPSPAGAVAGTGGAVANTYGGVSLRLWARRRPVALGASAAGASVRSALMPIGIVTLLAVAAPLLATHSALDVTSAGPFHAPSFAYPLGH